MATRKAPTPPPPGERAKRPPKGKSKQRRYAMTYCRWTDDSADASTHRHEEIKSTSVTSAHTALVSMLKQGAKRKIGKPDVVLIEAALIPRGQTLEQFLGLDDAEDDGEE